MDDYLTAQRLQEIKEKVIQLQTKRASGYGSDLIHHKITNESDPEEERLGVVDATARDIKNALLDFNDFDNDNTMYAGSYFAEDLDHLDARVDTLINADEEHHGCRGACTGLCTGSCSQTCSGCTGDTAGAQGCGAGNCSGGCRGSASSVTYAMATPTPVIPKPISR